MSKLLVYCHNNKYGLKLNKYEFRADIIHADELSSKLINTNIINIFSV